MTDASTALQRIRDLERSLLDPAVRADADALARLLADDFVEYGSSGRIFSKADVLAMLPKERGLAYSLSDFTATPLGPDTVLATYRAALDDGGSVRHSLHSSLWVHRNGCWRVRFHQGTLCETDRRDVMNEELEELAREAVGCRVCFERLPVEAPLIDIAQPRWVGPRYRDARPRIAMLLLNPGSGEDRGREADRVFRDLLVGFRNGTTPLAEVFDHQARDMVEWGRGRFRSFYIDGLGLDLDEVAFANVAWCATSGNKYPTTMLRECYGRFTSRLLTILDPHVVLCSGTSVHGFAARIQELLPRAEVLRVLHYAHRKGRAVQEADLRRIARALENARRS